MRLTSKAFNNGNAVPRRFTCDGENVSSPLQWADAPAETQSFDLLCDDPDAPSGVWRHWAIHDIPSTTLRLAEGRFRRC
jgi:Raf kinase inhibitor-like YbhB/YbcL family protein